MQNIPDETIKYSVKFDAGRLWREKEQIQMQTFSLSFGPLSHFLPIWNVDNIREKLKRERKRKLRK